MEYTQAAAEIKKGLIRPVYLLHGEESLLAKKLERAIVDAVLPPEDRDMNLVALERDPAPGELAALIETVPFMGGKNVIIIRGTHLFRAGRKAGGAEEGAADGGDVRLLKLIGEMPEYTRLIFVTPEKADKRRKIYKVIEQAGAVVEVSPLKAKDTRPWILSKAAEMGRAIAPDALEHLLTAVSMMPQISLGFIDNELEKIALYAPNRTITRKDVVAVMSAVPEISVFAMIEALSQKQTGKALMLLEEQFAAGENAIRLLALLTRQVRLLWLCRELADKGASSSAIAGQLAVPPFVGEKLARQCRAFTAEKLRSVMITLAEADHDLKFGRADKFVLEQIIINICK